MKGGWFWNETKRNTHTRQKNENSKEQKRKSKKKKKQKKKIKKKAEERQEQAKSMEDLEKQHAMALIAIKDSQAMIKQIVALDKIGCLNESDDVWQTKHWIA